MYDEIFTTQLCTPHGNLHPFKKFVPLLEISTPKYVPLQEIYTPAGSQFVPQNMYPSWKFVHQNEIAQVVRIFTAFSHTDGSSNSGPDGCVDPLTIDSIAPGTIYALTQLGTDGAEIGHLAQLFRRTTTA